MNLEQKLQSKESLLCYLWVLEKLAVLQEGM